MNAHVTIVVPASLVDAARNLAECLAPGGHGMYITGLSADGNEPATHYISSGTMQVAFINLLSDASATHAAAEQGAVQQGLTLTATLADCEALVAQSDISADEPFSAMARLGLQLVQTEEI